MIKKNNDYFLFFGANDIQSDEEIGGIGIAKANNPEGPYKDYLGKPLISKFYNGAQPIDQFVFEDEGDAIADSPVGPFNRIGKILQQDREIATGAGHHSVFKVPGEDSYYIVYHRRPLGETDGNSREISIEEMHFDENGFIKPVVLTHKGVNAHFIER